MEKRIDWISKAGDFLQSLSDPIVPLNSLEMRLAEFSSAGHASPTVVQQKMLAKRLQAQLSGLQGTDIKRAASDLIRSLNPFDPAGAAPEPWADSADGESTTAASSSAAAPEVIGAQVSIGSLRISLNAKP